MKKLTILFFLTIFTANFLAQSGGNYEAKSYGKTLLCDASDFFQTGVDLIAQPFVWNKEDWLKTGATFAVTGALFIIDDEARTFALKNRSDFNDKLFSIDDWITGWKSLILPSAVYTYGFFSRNKNVRSLGLQSAEAVIYSAVVAQILKILFGRARPFNNRGNLNFQPFTIDDNYYSLPSGHATAAFALASVFSGAFDNFYWKALCYGTAGTIAFARVYHDKHWISDIFLGSVIGFSIGKFVSRRTGRAIQFGGIKLQPYITINGAGILGRF